MESIIEFLVLAFLQFPGALIRFIIFRKKSYDEYLDDSWEYNAFAFAIFVGIIVGALKLFLLV